ncbi:hypothetical protein THAOC_28059 [Thalassiosira oceanica]|uniref:Uncharacterized protein n=1 Tax=Thalassiosira oceanica TaxID=159749 RepID=K0RG07_THAOC|nr:hypothetical protein THAOC_28059 [Thalassiosira oceanica]|eukprot:EJK52648.1 hypothetical protein THAOC_28059 [Thalassiosira oceanica]
MQRADASPFTCRACRAGCSRRVPSRRLEIPRIRTRAQRGHSKRASHRPRGGVGRNKSVYPVGLGFGRQRPQPEVVTRLGLLMRQSTSGMGDEGGPWRGERESNDQLRGCNVLDLSSPCNFSVQRAATLAGWAVQGGERLAETRGNLEPMKQ